MARDPVLLVGGAPRVPVDAIRHLVVPATGHTVAALARLLRARTVPCWTLLAVDTHLEADEGYATREDLEATLQRWIGDHPTTTLVMSAAINDYDTVAVEYRRDGRTVVCPADEKLPSGAEAVVIRLQPASKVIDRLAGWGHRGRLVAFKYEHAATVIASAARLRERVAADAVVANSLDGTVQALITAEGVDRAANRGELLERLVARIAGGL